MKYIKLFEDYINTNRFLYHKASPLVREYILKNGITPREKSAAWLSNTPIEGKATFASNSENKEEWFDTTYDDDIWKIDNSVANVKWKEDPNFIQGETAYVYTQEFIKPEALQLIYKGTGKDNSNNNI